MFEQGMHHTSTEIRVFACDAIYYISENTTNIPGEFLNLTLSDLVSLTKDKNTLIKCSAENALCSIMKYGKDESHLKVLTPDTYSLGYSFSETQLNIMFIWFYLTCT